MNPTAVFVFWEGLRLLAESMYFGVPFLPLQAKKSATNLGKNVDNIPPEDRLQARMIQAQRERTVAWVRGLSLTTKFGVHSPASLSVGSKFC